MTVEGAGNGMRFLRGLLLRNVGQCLSTDRLARSSSLGTSAGLAASSRLHSSLNTFCGGPRRGSIIRLVRGTARRIRGTVHQLRQDTWVGFFIDDFLGDTGVEVRMRLELEDDVENVDEQKNLM